MPFGIQENQDAGKQIEGVASKSNLEQNLQVSEALKTFLEIGEFPILKIKGGEDITLKLSPFLIFEKFSDDLNNLFNQIALLGYALKTATEKGVEIRITEEAPNYFRLTLKFPEELEYVDRFKLESVLDVAGTALSLKRKQVENELTILLYDDDIQMLTEKINRNFKERSGVFKL